MTLNITGKQLTIAGMGGLLGAAYLSLSPQLNITLKALMATSSITLLAGLYLNSRATPKPTDDPTTTKVETVALKGEVQTTPEIENPIYDGPPYVTIGEWTITLEETGKNFAECYFGITGDDNLYSGADLLQHPRADDILSGLGFEAPQPPVSADLDNILNGLDSAEARRHLAEAYGRDMDQAYLFTPSGDDPQNIPIFLVVKDPRDIQLRRQRCDALSNEDRTRLAKDLIAIMGNTARADKPKPCYHAEAQRVVFYDTRLQDADENTLTRFNLMRKWAQDQIDPSELTLAQLDPRASYTRPPDSQ